MPYKDPAKHRLYMKIRQREQKASREAEAKKSKLAIIESFLPDMAEGIDPNKLLVRPEVKKVRQITKRRVTDVRVKVDGKEVPGYDKKPLDVSTAKTIERVPDHLKEIVNRIQQTCLVDRHVIVTPIWVKRQIELYEKDDISELIVLKNFFRHMHLGHKIEGYKELVKAGRMKAKDALESREMKEAMTMNKKITDLREAFERFVIVKMLEGKSDDEILSEAKTYEETQGYFRWYMEGSARQIIEEIREILYPRRGKDFGELTREETEFMLNITATDAKIKHFAAAKRLIDAKKKGKVKKEKKKGRTYQVTVEE